MTDREKIAMGECVSPLTTERCPVCVDICEAAQARRRHNQLLIDTGLKEGCNHKRLEPIEGTDFSYCIDCKKNVR